MCTVIYKKTGEKYDVYSIVNNSNGYPHFLIYIDNQWKWISARHFVPSSYPLPF